MASDNDPRRGSRDGTPGTPVHPQPCRRVTRRAMCKPLTMPGLGLLT